MDPTPLRGKRKKIKIIEKAPEKKIIVVRDLSVKCPRSDSHGHTTSRWKAPKHLVDAYHKLKKMDSSVEECVAFLSKEDDTHQSDTSAVSNNEVSMEIDEYVPR